MPTVPISTPETAGPISREVWNTAELSAIALRTYGAGTSSLTNTWRVGLSTTITRPWASANAYTYSTRTCPVSVRTARLPLSAPLRDWVMMRIVRFGKRSASMPPCTPSSSIGRNCIAIVTPTAAELPVSSSTSQSSAMLCIHVPVLATT